LWIELDGPLSGGTDDYTGSDRMRHTPIAPFTGAVADSGEVHWTSDGSTITVHPGVSTWLAGRRRVLARAVHAKEEGSDVRSCRASQGQRC
jgi:hypothetical protein